MMRAAIYIALLCSSSVACGREVEWPLVVHAPADHREWLYGLIETSSELNAKLGCPAVTFTDRDALVQIRWVNEQEFRERFGVDALGARENVIDSNPVTQPLRAVRWWFAIDYQDATPREVGIVWLGFVASMAGLPYGSHDPQSIMYNHATHNPRPVDRLIEELGGTIAARAKMCGGA